MKGRNAPLISVITPVYNAGEVLRQTADAVLGQTFTSLEWVVVDDGSSSAETLSVLAQLVHRDERVRLVRHPSNKGLPAARNTGVRESSAPFLFFLDGDDLVDPTFLEKAYWCLSLNKELSFVNSYVEGFGAKTYKWRGGFHEWEVFLQENRNTSCFMARRAVMEQVLFDESMREGCEDWDFWLHAASKGYWGYTIPEFLFFYRRSETEKWTTLAGKQAMEAMGRQLRTRYLHLDAQRFPNPQLTVAPFSVPAKITDTPSGATGKHLLCIFPWLHLGGVEQFNIQVLKGLRQKGWQITILTTLRDEHLWEDRFRAITTDIIHLANIATESQFIPLVEAFICSRPVQAVFLSHSMYGYFVTPWLKQRFPALPVVDFLHCEEENWLDGGYPNISALFHEFLDRTFVSSEHLKGYCIQKGKPTAKIEVCYTNVDADEVKRDIERGRALRDQLQIGNEELVLLFVARLTEQKQPMVLVEVVERLKQAGKAFRCVVIGDGPDRERFVQEVRKRGLKEYFIYLGKQTNEVVLDYMSACDIFFLPSLYEGIALTLYEAMAKELVIVGADVGGQRELVDDSCGFLVQPSAPASEAEAYFRILGALLDEPQRVKAMGQAGRRRVAARFHLSQTLRLLDEALSGIRPEAVSPTALGQAYGLVMNRVFFLEGEKAKLEERTASAAYRILSRYEEPYQKAKGIYKKLKQKINQ